MGIWAGWSLRLLGVLLLPAVCVAHGAVVVWLYQAWSDAVGPGTPPPTTMLLILLALIVLILLVTVALMLAAIAIGMWVWDTMDRDSVSSILAISMLLALGGLAAGYVGTLVGVDSWALLWRGVETACTVRHVETVGGTVTQDGPAPVTYLYDLECAAADAPDQMWSSSFVVPGKGVLVLYDPHGDVGAQSKSQAAEATAWAWVTGIALAVWTVLTLAKVCLELPFGQRVGAPSCEPE